jgi:hypothetical protein
MKLALPDAAPAAHDGHRPARILGVALDLANSGVGRTPPVAAGILASIDPIGGFVATPRSNDSGGTRTSPVERSKSGDKTFFGYGPWLADGTSDV